MGAVTIAIEINKPGSCNCLFCSFSAAKPHSRPNEAPSCLGSVPGSPRRALHQQSFAHTFFTQIKIHSTTKSLTLIAAVIYRENIAAS